MEGKIVIKGGGEGKIIIKGRGGGGDGGGKWGEWKGGKTVGNEKKDLFNVSLTIRINK